MIQPYAQRIHDIFLDAIELPDGLRGHFLEGACVDDPELRVAVEELLDALGRAGEFLADPTQAELVRPHFSAAQRLCASHVRVPAPHPRSSAVPFSASRPISTC
jgi:hypothetical protein